MNRLTLRVPPDLLRRFDAVASGRGGRSRFLRRLMEAEALARVPDGPAASGGARRGKLTLRLTEQDLVVLEVEAEAAGLSRTQWASALIRRRLHGRPQLTPPEVFALIEVRREIRRIGVNINQIARTLGAAPGRGVALEAELAELDGFRTELAAWVAALGGAFQGNLDYWASVS